MTGGRDGRALAAVGLVLVACLAPWPFAAVEPFWWAIACGSSLAIAAAALLFPRDTARSRRLPHEALLAALAPPLVALFSALPLPARLVGLLSPGTVAALERAGVDATTGWRALSLFAPAGLDSAVILGACGVTAWLVAAAATDARRLRTLTRIFIAGGVLLAVFGLVQRLVDPSSQRMFWSVEIYEAGTPFGPYVNRNHFGGAMLLFTGVAAGHSLAARGAGRRRESWLSASAALTMALALAGTASRGAILGLTVLAAMLVLASPGRSRLRLGAAIVGIAILVAAGLVASGLFEELAGRLFHVYGRWQNRFLVQQDALRVFTEFPLFGTGAGTFPWVYHAFQGVDDARHFADAHSDWAQLLMDTGLVGVAALACVARALTSAARRGLRSAAAARWHVLGAVAGCAAIVVHGFFETNLHIPANALLASVVAGLAYGAAIGLAPAGAGVAASGRGETA